MRKLATKPLNIILLGDPAAGKATHGALLVKKFPLYDFDMGKELTRRRAADKNWDKIMSQTIDQGKLAPTSLVRAILRETITRTPLDVGILFDGHPKMLGEAKIVARLLKSLNRLDPIVIYLTIPLSETVRRMPARHGYFNGKFGKRRDDTTAALKNRARYYRKNIADVVNFFQSRYYYKKISSLGTKAEVFSKIMTEINRYQRTLE
jgi:adenylate kinase